MFVAKAGPDVGAGGGGGAAAGAAAPAAGGASGGTGAAATPPAQGSGVGTQVAPATGAAAGAVATGQQQAKPADSEWYEFKGEDGKPTRVKRVALESAFRREQAMNRTFAQFQQEKLETERKANEVEQRIKAISEGRLGEFFPKNMTRDQRIAYLAKTLKEDLDGEQQEMDPTQRALLERANKGDEAARKLAEIQKQQDEAEHTRMVAERREQLAETFGGALKEFKLPKNDVTLSLMAQAQGEARDEGWDLSPKALAETTHKLTTEMFDAMSAHCYKPDGSIDDDAALEMLEAFPKFERVLHRGLLVRHERRRIAAGVAVQQQPKPVEKKQTETATNEPKLMNSVEEAKAYGVRGLRTI